MLHITLEGGQRQPDGLFKILGRCAPEGPWIAGGAARHLYFEEFLPATSDVDVFCKTAGQIEAIGEWIVDQGGRSIEGGKNWTKYYLGEVSVQVVHTRFTCLEEVLNSFDFRMCMFGCDGREITYSETGESDARHKYLEINRLKLPAYTLARIVKYTEQGFRVPYPEGMLTKLAEAAREQLYEQGEVGYGDL